MTFNIILGTIIFYDTVNAIKLFERKIHSKYAAAVFAAITAGFLLT